MSTSTKKSKKLKVKAHEAAFKKFFETFSHTQAQEELWKMFHHSMTKNQIGEIDSDERESSFFYYTRLKEFISNAHSAL